MIDQKSAFSALLAEAISKPGIISAAYSAFHDYSIGNQLLAAFQCMARGLELGPIGTYKAWQNKGRQVRKGEKAITLCMPVTITAEGVNAATGETEKRKFTKFAFRPQWFVMTQTDGVDLANEVITPEWDAALALEKLDIATEPFKYMDGNCQGYATGRRIAINPVAQYPHKTRFHELAHVVLGHTAEHAMTDSDRTPRDIREVEAESVAYILISLLGLPGQTESRGYIQSWLKGNDIPEKSAKRIFNAADKIMKAGQTRMGE